MRKTALAAAVLLAGAVALAGCSGAGGGGGGSGQSINVLMVANPQMTDIQKLTADTFTLRYDVTFSDGTALTSDVVAANFDAIVALGASASLANGYFAGYTGTEVTSDTEFTVDFSAPNVQFLQGGLSFALAEASRRGRFQLQALAA